MGDKKQDEEAYNHYIKLLKRKDDMTLDQIRIDKSRLMPDRDTIRSGSIPGHGLYSCIDCSVKWLLEDYEDLPDCPECEGVEFEKEYYGPGL
jgi:hypothetical protein